MIYFGVICLEVLIDHCFASSVDLVDFDPRAIRFGAEDTAPVF